MFPVHLLRCLAGVTFAIFPASFQTSSTTSHKFFQQMMRPTFAIPPYPPSHLKTGDSDMMNFTFPIHSVASETHKSWGRGGDPAKVWSRFPAHQSRRITLETRIRHETAHVHILHFPSVTNWNWSVVPGSKTFQGPGLFRNAHRLHWERSRPPAGKCVLPRVKPLRRRRRRGAKVFGEKFFLCLLPVGRG